MNGTSYDHTYFWLRRANVLSGLIFIAAFVALFLVPYSSIFDGPAAFNRTMVRIDAIPMLGWAMALFVLLPLTFHAAMGILSVYSSNINIVSYGYYRNWMYALRRLAGLALIPFVAYHIYAAVLRPSVSGLPLTADAMHRMIASPWSKWFYLAGIACAAFYAGNGIASGAVTMGLAASRRARSAFTVAGWMVTIALAAWGAKLVLSF